MSKSPLSLLNLTAPIPSVSNLLKVFSSYPNLKILYKSPNTLTKSQAVSSLSNIFKPLSLPNINKDHLFFPFDYMMPLIKSLKSPQTNKESLVLLCGDENGMESLSRELDLPSYLTMSEYCKLFPQLVPISKRTRKDIEPTREKVLRRMPFMKGWNFDYPFQISGVFFLDDVTDWEEYGQVVTDLLSSNDGKIAKKFPEKPVKKHIEIHFSSSEMFSVDEKGNKILGLGGLREALNTCYKLIYKEDLEFKNPEEEILKFIGKIYNDYYLFFIGLQ